MTDTKIKIDFGEKKKIKPNIQKKKKKMSSLKQPLLSSSDYAQEMINDSNDIDIDMAEELINQAEDIIKHEKIPEIKHNQEEIKKEVINKIDLKEIDTDIRKCPLCKNKTKRGKVIIKDNILHQVIKCKNKNCPYVKEIISQI